MRRPGKDIRVVDKVCWRLYHEGEQDEQIEVDQGWQEVAGLVEHRVLYLVQGLIVKLALELIGR